MLNTEKVKGSVLRVKMIALSNPVRYSIQYVENGKPANEIKPKLPENLSNVSLKDMTSLSKQFETVELMEGQLPYDGLNA